MKRFYSLLILSVFLFPVIVLSLPVNAFLSPVQIKTLDIPLSYKTDCYAEGSSFGGIAAHACDHNWTNTYITSTEWVSGNVWPHWIVINLTNPGRISSITMNTGDDIANSGRFQIWAGSWVTYKNWTNTDFPVRTNNTVSLDTLSPVTSSFRVYGVSGSTNYMTAGEIGPNTPPPSLDFSIKSSSSSLTFQSNDVAHETISANGINGFTGNVSISASSSMFGNIGVTVVCFPSKIKVNVSTSDCVFNSMFAGQFNVTITGTNSTIIKTHSVYISVIVTGRADNSLLILTFLLLLFAFVFLFIYGFVERFSMLGAAIVAMVIAIEGVLLTNDLFVPTIFILLMTVCITISITRKQ